MIMGLLGGILRTVAPLALTALTGGAAAPLVMAQQMAVRFAAQQVLQMAAQTLGIPPQILSVASSALTSAMSPFPGANLNVPGLGTFSNVQELRQGLQALGFTPLQSANIERYAIGQARRAIQEFQKQGMEDSIQNFINQINRDNSNKKLNRDVNAVLNGKGSILMKLAVALGQIADQKLNDMAKKAQDIGNMGKIEAKNQSKFSQMNAELNALGQEFGIVSQAMNNVLKSIGEGASTVARKN
jgi:hypothetical protein